MEAKDSEAMAAGYAQGVVVGEGRAAKRIAELESKLGEETAIVSRVWIALGITTMEQAKGKEISEIVRDLVEQVKEFSVPCDCHQQCSECGK
jgi:hypothetical protein